MLRFDTYIPCDRLKPYIKSIAISEASEEATYKVLPDTGLVLGFQYKGRLKLMDQGQAILLSPSGLSGLHDRHRMFGNAPNTGTVLVYFKEAGAAMFFKEPVHELFRDSVSLEHFMLRSELLLLEEQLCEAASDRKRIALVEHFLLTRLRDTPPDDLIVTALKLIHAHQGHIRIRDLTARLHISQSPLEKRFRQAVGASPKKFASIVRFRQVLQDYKTEQSLTELGYASGFYDQAHFIKEFKTFTGDTPETFFKRI